MTKDKKNYNILVIEDNAGDFLLIEDYLNERIATPAITHACNFEAASKALKDQQDNYDVILLDLSLPDKSGKRLITEINSLCDTCPIIVLTGRADFDFGVSSIAMGISDYLLKDDINATSLYKSIVYNIERRKINLRLKESEAKYSNLFLLSPQPMWVFDPENLNFIQVNKAATQLYGYSEKQFLAMTILDLIPEEDRNRSGTQLKQARSSGDIVLKGATRHVKKSGEILDIEIYSNPITLDNKIYNFIIAIDVTEKLLYEHKITRAIIKTQEDERYEVGGELHDNVCQILATSLISLGMIKNVIPPSDAGLYGNCREHILLAVSEIRNISHRLAPAFFETSSLEESLQTVLNSFNIDHYFKIHLCYSLTPADYVVPKDIQLTLYRILQEQLSNIYKHAKARDITVEVCIAAGIIKMRIKDNGVGFDLTVQKNGIGLANIKRRAELFFGHMEIHAAPGKGCELEISIPI